MSLRRTSRLLESIGDEKMGIKQNLVMTLDEVALMFRVSRRTILRRVNEGSLPAPYRIGTSRIYNFSRETIENFNKEQSEQANSKKLTK